MARRSTASAVINFGLVAIPVKFYVAASGDDVSFRLMSPYGNRVSQVYRDAVTGEDVERSTMNRGYEVSKNEIVIFQDEEIKALEESGSGEIEIKEFVPARTVDLLHVEKSYHLSPGKGGDKSYTLLAKALLKTEQYAVAQYSARGKRHVVVIRPYKDGLVLHQMFLASEVREFESDVAKINVSDAEVNMACMLINILKKDEYDVSQYTNDFKERVLKAVETKRTGNPATPSNEPAKKDVIDLMEALKASLAATKA